MIFRGISFLVGFVLLSFPAIAQSSGPTRIALINSYEFGNEKTGITKYVKANILAIGEHGPARDEMIAMGTRLQTLNKEIEELRKLSVVDQASIQTKYEEVEKLQRDIKYKTEDAKARLERRQRMILGPVLVSIGKALQEYAKLEEY